MNENYHQIQRQANELRRKEAYSDALPLYRQLWSTMPDLCSHWDGWGLAFCLKKCAHYQEALDVCRQVYKRHPDFEFNRDCYASVIFELEIKGKKPNDEQRFLKAAKAIVALTRQDSPFSFFTATIFSVLGYLEKQNKYPANEILQWTSLLQPELLSNEPFSFTDEKGRKRELASHFERYFTYRCKALFELCRYDDAIALCNHALEKISSFHYDNDIWLERLIALSWYHRGDYQKSADKLEQLVLRKPIWFMQHELALAYLKMGNRHQALLYMIKAALNDGEWALKINLITQIGDLLWYDGNREMARLHLEVILLIRLRMEWGIHQPLQAKMTEREVLLPDIAHWHKCSSLLKQWWAHQQNANLPKLQGKIIRILGEGHAGFIQSGNKSYFFKSREFKAHSSKMQINQKVTFTTTDSYDPAKKRATVIAIDIRILL